ncbi:MAG: methyltransferase domain-containing protein [Candidatus Krumholzibacteriia bacterium]
MPATQTFPLPNGYRHRPHLMPWWLGYLQLVPLRRLVQNPHALLRPLIGPGETVLEVGPGMGFHTLPAAELTGPTGRVIAVDCQERMLQHLERRAADRGLRARIETRACRRDSLLVNHLAGTVDLALAYNVVHEAADPERMLGEVARALRSGGRLVLSEPRGHVDRDVFLWEYGLCREAGLEACSWPRVPRQMTVVLRKPE